MNNKVKVKAKVVGIPQSKNPIGYTKEEIGDICKSLGVSINQFNEHFGTNTGIIDEETMEFLIFDCDVLNTLNKIIKGKYLYFD